jgi:uncharacterized membrane protein YphA (DoxX/SURF4 family)
VTVTDALPWALLWAVSLVMVASGAMKLADPSATADTLDRLSAPGGMVTARLLGLAEVGVGLAVLAVGGRGLAALVGVLYLGFAGIVIAARSKGLPTCGCFGSRSAPPRIGHVIVNALSAVVAFVAAAGPNAPEPVADGLGDLSGAGAVVVGVAVLVGAIGLIVFDTSGSSVP